MPLSEIKANDFNLNIPRYIDTFEEEESINLDLIANKIKEIDNDMINIDNKIKSFCDELGIVSPF